MPQTTNQQRTQNKTTCLILPIRKDGGRRQLSEVEDMPRTTKLTSRTRHAPTQNTKQITCLLKKKVAEGHLLKYKTCTQRLNFQRIQDLPQLINKKPTQNTKQNHMLIKKEGGRRHSQTGQDMPQHRTKAKPHVY